MHERTRQAIARLLFVLCCAGPLILMTLWILATSTPWYQDQVVSSLRKEMQDELGLLVRFDHYRHPAPDHWIFSDLILSHPETSDPISRIREVHWVRTGVKSRILLQQPTLEASQVFMLWESLHDHFLCRPHKLRGPVAISVNDLTIQNGNHAFTLSEIDASITNELDAASLSLQLQVADGLTHSPIAMQIRRERTDSTQSNSDKPRTTISLNTNQTPVPCSALTGFWPTLESLGPEATFSGNLIWKNEADHWSVDLGNCRFEQVELDRLFENQIHRLSGTAEIQLERCFISPSRNQSDIAGTLHAKKGLIGKTLLRSAAENLKVRLFETQSWGQFSGDLPYDLLALGFSINGTQLQLDGVCHEERGYENYPSGVVLILNGYPLAQSSDQATESLRLLAAIAPTHSVPVPLSQQTSWLTKILIPPSRPVTLEQTAPPRIRSAGVWQGGPTIDQPQ